MILHKALELLSGADIPYTCDASRVIVLERYSNHIKDFH